MFEVVRQYRSGAEEVVDTYMDRDGAFNEATVCNYHHMHTGFNDSVFFVREV